MKKASDLNNNLQLIGAKFEQAALIERELEVLKNHKGPWSSEEHGNERLDFIEAEFATYSDRLDTNLHNISKVLSHIHHKLAHVKSLKTPKYDQKLNNGYVKKITHIETKKAGQKPEVNDHVEYTNPLKPAENGKKTLQEKVDEKWKELNANKNVPKYHAVKTGDIWLANAKAHLKRYKNKHGVIRKDHPLMKKVIHRKKHALKKAGVTDAKAAAAVAKKDDGKKNDGKKHHKKHGKKGKKNKKAVKKDEAKKKEDDVKKTAPAAEVKKEEKKQR